MARRKTAGELSLQASSDITKYDYLEVGHALTDDIGTQLMICAERHRNIFNEDEYCVGYVIAGDPLIKNVMRRKFFAMLYLPSPRPNQAVFLYNKSKDQITKRLWVLPPADVMAMLSERSFVDKQYLTMKAWSDAFFHSWSFDEQAKGWINNTPTYFFDFIRKQHGITMLSEKEYLNAHREELIKAGCKDTETIPSEAFDFSKITIEKIVDTKTAVIDEGILDNCGKA
jgi:hypothetical protein